MTCISLCAIFLTKAQTVDLRPTADVAGPVFAHADSLYRAGSYFEASIAYERVLFENTDRGQQLEAVLGKTRCLKMLGSYDQARTFLESWQGLPFPDSGLTEIHYQQVLCTYLGGHFEEVLSLVDRWPYTHAGKSPAPFLIVLKILSLNELQRWKEAAETYRSFIAQMHLAAPPPDLYAHIPHLKDVNKAQWLSQFIPGAGQFYVGKPLDGVISLVVQAAGVYFAVLSFEQHYYISAWLIGAALFGAFHLGGVRRAEVLALEYNRKKMLLFNEQVREQLLALMRQ